MITRSKAQELLHAIILEVQATNPSFPTEAVRGLFDVGELRVGLEILCDNLAEADIKLSERAKADIESVGSLLGMPPEYWRDLATKADAPSQQ